MKTRRILQIDGGGKMGVVPALFLEQLEAETLKKYGKRLYEVFDLISGTSTGAIIGGAIAAGIPAREIARLYVEKGAELFKKRSQWNPSNWLSPMYDREPFLREMLITRDFTGKPLGRRTLSELRTRFLATAFNLCSQRTHFLKSWKDKDRNLPLVDVLNWSALSAAHFFGKVNAPNYEWDLYGPDGKQIRSVRGAVMQDGGQGYHNNTTGHILHEVMAHRWADNGRVLILSLGCGSPPRHIPYAKASEFGYLREIKEFMENQARGESVIAQTLVGGYIGNKHSRVDYRRISTRVRAEENGLDKIEFIPRYREYAHDLVHRNLNDRLVADLCR